MRDTLKKAEKNFSGFLFFGQKLKITGRFMSIVYCIVFSAFREEITRKNYSVVFCPKGILKFQVEIKNYKTEMLKNDRKQKE